MDNNAQTMGKRIAAQRKKKGITQEQLSQRLGVTPQAVSKWENDLSCPDISILPMLAKELDVSVDFLLGRKSQEEKKEAKEYIVITKETEGEEDMDEDKKGKVYLRFNLHDKWGAIFAALLLVGAGVLFLLQEFGVVTLAQDISIWGIVWPLLVLIGGVSSLVSECNPCTVGITVFGLYKFLYNLGLLPKEWLLTWSMAWPIIIIIVGLTILQSTLLPKGKRKHGKKSSEHGKGHLVTRCGYEDGLLKVECDFGDMHPAPTGPFIGGNVEVNFGNCVLDLTQCESFAENSTLHGEVNFGELTVIVPSCVKVIMDSESAFGSCSAPASDENTTCTMTVKGESNFGDLKVQYGA